MQSIHLLRLISTAQKFLNLLILMLFSASAIFFLFRLFYIGKMFPFGTLRSFFIWGNKEKFLGVRLGELGGLGMRIRLILVKNC